MVLWPGILVGSLGDAVAAPEIEKASAEEPIESEEGWTAGEEGLEGKLISTDGYEIEELIDLGFREKNAENAKQAAAYFFQALKQDPEPDLAFSLIMECMDLWGKLGKRDFALDELQTYIQKYLLLFDKDLHFHFYTWMVKEKIQMI